MTKEELLEDAEELDRLENRIFSIFDEINSQERSHAQMLFGGIVRMFKSAKFSELYSRYEKNFKAYLKMKYTFYIQCLKVCIAEMEEQYIFRKLDNCVLEAICLFEKSLEDFKRNVDNKYQISNQFFCYRKSGLNRDGYYNWHPLRETNVSDIENMLSNPFPVNELSWSTFDFFCEKLYTLMHMKQAYQDEYDKYDAETQNIMSNRFNSDANKIEEIAKLLLAKSTLLDKTKYNFWEEENFFKYYNQNYGWVEFKKKEDKEYLREKRDVLEKQAFELMKKPDYDKYIGFKKELQNFYYNDFLKKWHATDYSSFKSFIGDPLRCFLNNLSYLTPRFSTSGAVHFSNNDFMFHLFSKYKKIICFDTETTGLYTEANDLIEFAYVSYGIIDKNPHYSYDEPYVLKSTAEEDIFIKLPEHKNIPEEIVKLTGITMSKLNQNGLEIQSAQDKIFNLFNENKDALFIAYNAGFDISFISEFLKERAYVLYDINFFDAYTFISQNIHTWYNKRVEGFKLANVIDWMCLNSKANNNHTAISDAKAVYYVVRELEKFGYGERMLNNTNYMKPPQNNKYRLPNIKYTDE